MKNINVQMTVKMRATFRSRIRMYDNDWADQLDDELKRQFHEKTYPKVKLMADTSQNIFRRIVREICTVYREPADRIVKGAAEGIQEKANELFRKIKLDQTMQVAHRYAKAATISFVLVRLRADGAPVLRVLGPDQVYVEYDAEDPTQMSLFAYEGEINDPKGKRRIIWTVYSATELWYCDYSGKALDKDPRTNEVYKTDNCYGCIPAVAFPSEFQIRSFWNESWNRDAAEANMKIGLLTTYMNYLVKTQSFKQITINADKVSEDLKDQILDPLFPLLMSGQATAATLDLNTQLAAIDQVIRGKVSAIANNYGISNENFTLTTQAASGFSLKIANQSLQDIREADIPLCSYVEQALYRIIAKVTEELPDESEIQFNPGEVSWPEEWGTEQSRWDFEFKNGISSPVDYVLVHDPQKSRDEAIKLIKDRQQEIKQLKPSMSAWDLILGGESAQPTGGGQSSGVLAALAGAADSGTEEGAAVTIAGAST